MRLEKIRTGAKIVWEIFKRDARQILKNPVAMIIALGVVVLPSVYAWATIAADWDPYERTQYLEVGFVNLDKGAEMPGGLSGTKTGPGGGGTEEVSGETGEKGGSGEKLNLGAEVEQELRENHDLGWQFVDENQAMTGVESGEYYAAIVIPENFSEDFLSVLSGEYRRPEIKYYVNEKISATAPEFTNSGANAVETEVNAQFTGTVSKAMVEIIQRAGVLVQDKAEAAEGSLLAEITETRAEIRTATETINGYAASVATLQGTIEEIRGVLEGVKAAIPGESTEIVAGQGKVTELRENLQRLDEGLAQLNRELEALGNEAVSGVEGEDMRDGGAGGLLSEEQREEILRWIRELQGRIAVINGQLSIMSGDATGALNSFSGALGTLNGTILGLGPTLDIAERGLFQINSTLDLAVTAGDSAKNVLGAVDQALSSAETDLSAITSAGVLEKVQGILKVSPEEISQFMASPVLLKTETLYPIKNYGTGVAPFFTNIAMWVAAFILVAMLHLTIDPRGLPKFSVTEAYLGRLLMFLVLGILQGLVVCVGDLIMGIQCAEPVLYVLAGVVAIVVNVNIMYALVFTMRHIGRAIGVVLLIMQIPGASGEYPVQMMPEFYQAIHPFLPFTYSIDAMREATGGMYGGQYWLDLLALVPFLAVALAFGLIAGRHAFNLNALFDKELSETELLITERKGSVEQRYRLRPILAILLKDKGYRKELEGRAERFQRRYPILVRIGWSLMIGTPILMVLIGMILPRSADIRLVLLLLMVVGVILSGIYLTSVEFLRYSLKNQVAVRGDVDKSTKSGSVAEGRVGGGQKKRRKTERRRK